MPRCAVRWRSRPATVTVSPRNKYRPGGRDRSGWEPAADRKAHPQDRKHSRLERGVPVAGTPTVLRATATPKPTNPPTHQGRAAWPPHANGPKPKEGSGCHLVCAGLGQGVPHLAGHTTRSGQRKSGSNSFSAAFRGSAHHCSPDAAHPPAVSGHLRTFGRFGRSSRWPRAAPPAPGRSTLLPRRCSGSLPRCGIPGR